MDQHRQAIAEIISSLNATDLATFTTIVVAMYNDMVIFGTDGRYSMSKKGIVIRDDVNKIHQISKTKTELYLAFSGNLDLGHSIVDAICQKWEFKIDVEDPEEVMKFIKTTFVLDNKLNKVGIVIGGVDRNGKTCLVLMELVNGEYKITKPNFVRLGSGKKNLPMSRPAIFGDESTRMLEIRNYVEHAILYDYGSGGLVKIKSIRTDHQIRLMIRYPYHFSNAGLMYFGDFDEERRIVDDYSDFGVDRRFLG